MRKICYITGTRADFGLMQNTLQAIHRFEGLELSMLVAGMHLDARYGRTICDIESSGLPITACVEFEPGPATGAKMARDIGRMLLGFTDALSSIRPDMLLLLGDRGEMLAGALAAIHLNIPVVHIHGGERSGTVDEPIRHAISKLSHFHFVATSEARDRLIRMGEQPANIYVSGAPGLDGIAALATESRFELCAEFKLDPGKKIALFVYHPVLQEAASAAADVRSVLELLVQDNIQVIAMKPNSDAGSDQIREVLENYANRNDVFVATHFPRNRFVSAMKAADLLIGNSSAGIIEAASFGTPVINIGSRQNMRERNLNVIDSSMERGAIAAAIARALDSGRFEIQNVYGDGKSAFRIARLLAKLVIKDHVLAKTNAY